MVMKISKNTNAYNFDLSVKVILISKENTFYPYAFESDQNKSKNTH
jgi:hypothetical protein